MKRLYYFFVMCGKALFVTFILFVISLSLYSLNIKGKVSYGDRCTINFDDEEIVNIEYTDISMTSHYLECNTYYLNYKTSLAEKEIIKFMAYLCTILRDNNITANFHLIIISSEYQYMATIVDYQISYIKTYI